MKASHFPCAIVALIFLAGCSGSKNSPSAEEMTSIVKERNERLGRYFVMGNSDSLATMYAPEARLCLNGVDFVTGRPAIAAFWKDDMKTSVTNTMLTETITVRGVRDVIYETGRTHLNMTYRDSTFNLTVKYCNVWRLQPDGGYLLDVDIANRDKD